MGYPMETRATVLDPLRWIVKFKPLLKTSAPNGKVAPKEARSSSQEVQRGNRYLSHSLAIEVAVARVPPRSQSLADLSSRELDALALLAKGKSYSQIAQELEVSYKTVVLATQEKAGRR